MDQTSIADAQAEPPEETIAGSSSRHGEVDLRTRPSESGDEVPLSPPDNGPKKGKQPEGYSPLQELPAEAEDITASDGASGLPRSLVEEDSPPAPPPLQPDDPRWAYSPDRPPAKLPIYFHDAVGRNYTFPWEKAKTWEGMERLIRACFAHVTPLAWYVNQRNYDLKVVESGAPEMPTAASAAFAGVSSQAFTTAVSPPTPDLAAYGPAGSSQQTPPLPDTPQQQPAAGSGAPFLRTVILPELWDELAVPGMSVTMLMWPMPTYHGTLPPPPPPPLLPPPPPPPPPISYPQYGGVPPLGRGYGRGGVPMGVGRGRGAASTRWSSPSRSPSPPPRRPKTRKRQGGGL